jgi:hypothetical protein
MSVINFRYGSAAVTITKFWTDFKDIAITKKALPIQYEEDTNIYYIFAEDGNSIYLCLIYKGTVMMPGYTQMQNDADKLDFTTNYQSTANTNISNNTQTIAGTVSVSSGTVEISGVGGKVPDVKLGTDAVVDTDNSLVVQVSPNQQSIPVHITGMTPRGMLLPGTITADYNIPTECKQKFVFGTPSYDAIHSTSVVSPGGGLVSWTYADGGTDVVDMIPKLEYKVAIMQINLSGTVVTDLQIFV